MSVPAKALSMCSFTLHAGILHLGNQEECERRRCDEWPEGFGDLTILRIRTCAVWIKIGEEDVRVWAICGDQGKP